VIVAYALGYGMGAAIKQGKIKGMPFPSDNKLLNVHFVDDQALTPTLNQQLVEGTLFGLDSFVDIMGGTISEVEPKSFCVVTMTLIG
jgi:hypothetical protein